MQPISPTANCTTPIFKKHVVDTVSRDEVKARYDKEVAAVPPQEEVQARHILVKTEDEAKAIIKDLDGGKDFADARQGKVDRSEQG